jgi:hypothetical protein
MLRLIASSRDSLNLLESGGVLTFELVSQLCLQKPLDANEAKVVMFLAESVPQNERVIKIP